MTIKHNRAAPFRDKVVAFVRTHPNCTSQDLADAFGMEHVTASASLYDTFKGGFTCRVRQGRSFHYWHKDDAPRAKDEAKPAPKHDTDEAVEALKARLAALEARLAEAEAKHPELREINYEAYSAALKAFYDATDGNEISTPMDNYDKELVRGLIAAMPLMPKGDDA